MTESILILLVLLQIKHWYIDFVNQSDEEVRGKAIYGNLHGIAHSAKHGLGTLLALVLATGGGNIIFAVILSVIDFILHYHIDWCKMNFGNRDIKTPQFWNHLGLDQMAHQLTYIGVAYLIL
jgi:hypothetical protein